MTNGTKMTLYPLWVFRFHEPDGAFRNYYCNVNMPPAYQDGVLDYVDLDIDVVVWKDLSYEVVDRDDFERNTVKYGYPDDVKQRAEESVAKLIRMIEGREFPLLESSTIRSQI